MESQIESMIQSITQRVKDWKKLFIATAGLEDLTEESRWIDILKRDSFDLSEVQKLMTKACSEVGCFSTDEAKYLRMLPWYYHVVDKFLPYVDMDMPDGNQFYIGREKGERDVCFIYHKKSMNLFECYIIAPEVAEMMTSDLLVFVPKLSFSAILQMGGVACISFVKEIPEHFKV